MELFLIRHAEAETPEIDPGDPDRLLLIDRYGSGDYSGELTARGRSQAETAGRFIRNAHVDVVFSSPTARAAQTAEIAARNTNLDVVTVPALKEIRIGFLRPERNRDVARAMERALRVNDVYRSLTGKPLFLPVALYFVRLYVSNWLRGRTEGGEPPSQVERRLRGALDVLEARMKELGAKRAAVFTHGYVIYYLANHLVAPHRRIGNILRRPFVRNVSVTHLYRTEAGWALESYAEPLPAEPTFGIGGG